MIIVNVLPTANAEAKNPAPNKIYLMMSINVTSPADLQHMLHIYQVSM